MGQMTGFPSVSLNPATSIMSHTIIQDLNCKIKEVVPEFMVIVSAENLGSILKVECLNATCQLL